MNTDTLLTPPVRRLMDVAARAEGEARVVGGAVRDALLERSTADIDLATTLPPDALIAALDAAGIKSVPTGIRHGTVTAVLDRKGYEITTLRRDVETDGRHATVAFTDDWRADAARRDFTMNALYLDAAGTIHDYFDGRADAQAGHVRFIGDPRARIREDVLRILRFFRFHAWFGQGEPDADGLKACADLAHLIPTLSAERIAKELLKLLAAPDPWSTWIAMTASEVTKFVLPDADDGVGMEYLQINEQAGRQTGLVRLAALLPRDRAIAWQTATRLKLSAVDNTQLMKLAVLPGQLAESQSPADLRRHLYFEGLRDTRAALFLLPHDRTALDKALTVIDAWSDPQFPIQGGDILKLGVPSGPRVGEIFRATEDHWINGDFRATRADLLAFAATLIPPAC